MVTDWTGGVYATAGMCGSRPGGPVAGAWAAMVKSGEEGYVDLYLIYRFYEEREKNSNEK